MAAFSGQQAVLDGHQRRFEEIARVGHRREQSDTLTGTFGHLDLSLELEVSQVHASGRADVKGFVQRAIGLLP
jgi:hypothetical protein